MRSYVLIAFILAGLIPNDHATTTNETVVLPASSPVLDSNAALSQLSTIASISPITPDAAIATNKPAWQSTVSFGLTATEGNSDSALVTGKFQTHIRTSRDEWTLGSDASYGEIDSIKNNETLHGFGQYNDFFDDRWYDYMRADALHDGIADVAYRFTFSPGAGYFFVRNKQTTLAGEAGPAILYEKLDDEYHDYPTARLAERFEQKFNGHDRFWQNVEFLPPVDSPGNFLVNAEIGIETAITKQFSLQTYVQDSFANEPAPGRMDNDAKLVSALAFKF